MDVSVQVAIISASASVVIAAITVIYTKRHQRQDELRQRKLDHYKTLLASLSDIAVDGTDESAHRNFALAVNTISLVAPQYVIDALMKFHDEIKYSNPNKSTEGHDKLLKHLLLAIRKDICLPFADNPDTFDFHLIGKAPPKSVSGK